MAQDTGETREMRVRILLAADCLGAYGRGALDFDKLEGCILPLCSRDCPLAVKVLIGARGNGRNRGRQGGPSALQEDAMKSGTEKNPNPHEAPLRQFLLARSRHVDHGYRTLRNGQIVTIATLERWQRRAAEGRA